MKRLLHINLFGRLESYQNQAFPSKIQHDRIPLQFKILVLSLLIVVLPFTKLFSNNLTVTLISADQPNQTVTFDLSWDNSWRNSSTTAANWDAAWVFVKWRNCTASANVQFTHGQISTTVGDHNFNVLSGATTFEPTTTDGTGNTIDPAPNNSGVMLRNVANPSAGTVSARIRLKVNNLPTSGNLDIRAYGIEMVFIPSGTYFLGDGNGTTKSYQSFCQSGNSSTAVSISSEAAQTIYESTSLLGNCSVTAPFPKGVQAFYIMKYEITQGSYVDFLNATFALSQSIHYPAQTTNRHTITNPSTGLYATTKPFRACNWLSWADFGAYLDWAALRPFTELEYEKACRGTALAVPYENAMGAITATRAATISGVEDGTETITTASANVCAGTTAFSGGDAGQGPLRGGIFATGSTSTRAQTGSSFYGVMELSGNVDEYCISALSGVSGSPSATGVPMGDGMLDDATGHFNLSNVWPQPLSPSNYIIHRGRNWDVITLAGSSTAGVQYLNVSDRQGGNSSGRSATSGGRGARGFITGTTSTITYTYQSFIEYFTVPPGVTSLTIDAYGAGGGISTSTNAGYGAEIKALCTVTPGEVLKILVGGVGSIARNGGGGTFVVRAPYNTLASVLVVAGGGGGQGSTNPSPAKNGQINVATGAGGDGYLNTGSGGQNGNGGLASTSNANTGGGGGFLTNGNPSGTYGGFSYISGGAGSAQSGTGGFGCGATSSSTTYGAGGGGYSGGGGGNATAGGGGGGGSFINGTTILTTGTGTQYGLSGKVILTW